MCDDNDREPPAKRSRDDARNASKSPTEQHICETTMFLDLNDDCLDEIFRYLNVIELSSVTQVCKRFQRSAEFLFKRKFNEGEFDFSTVWADRLLWSKQEAKDIIRNFGALLTSLTIPMVALHHDIIVGHVEEELLKDIVECCSKKLYQLTLKNFNFTSIAADALNMLAGKSLLSLSLHKCVLIEDCFLYLTNFTTLKCLTIADTTDCYPFTNVFPALEYLHLTNIFIPGDRIFQQFIHEHTQLKLLTIRFCKGISSGVVGTIGKLMKSLLRLQFSCNVSNATESFEQVQNNIQHLSELKNLEHFAWECGDHSIGNILSKMMANNVAMKLFAIGKSIVDDETIAAMKKMTNLESLDFIQMNGLLDQHLLEITKEMTQLKKLSIVYQVGVTFEGLQNVLCHTKELVELCIASNRFPLDARLYYDTLNIVKKRQNGIKLTIKIYSTNGIEDVDPIPQETLRMNSNWLIIEHSKKWGL